ALPAAERHPCRTAWTRSDIGRDARKRRDRRFLFGYRAAVASARLEENRPLVRGLPQRGARLFCEDRNFSDHAYDRHSPRSLREASLAGAIPLQGLQGSEVPRDGALSAPCDQFPHHLRLSLGERPL